MPPGRALATARGTVAAVRAQAKDRGGRAARAVTALALGGAAALHAAWACGSTWPAADRDALADLVVGRRPFPSRRDTAAVAVALGAATVVVAAPPRTGRAAPWHRRARRAIGVVLLARGAAGLVLVATGAYPTADIYRRWDTRLYSPLCLALGLGALRSSQDSS